MDDRDRLFIKVAQGPRNVRLETLEKLMELWGFDARVTKKGDNVLFWHTAFDVKASAAIPHHGPVLVTYVRDCLQAIEEVKIKEGGTDG